MSNTSPIHSSFTIVHKQPSCVDAEFHENGNAFMPISASDDRGTFYGLDFANVRPHLVEIIHSKAGVIRGNHIHLHCTEIFTVLSGELFMYLLCSCPKVHLYERKVSAGTTAVISPGTAHAIYTITENESIAVFGDGDPRNDRDRVNLIET